jgi:pimeloyl-ACP methyl ester carboxylesterase
VGEELQRRTRLVLAQQREQRVHHGALRLARRARDFARHGAPAPRLDGNEIGERAADVDAHAQRAPLRHGRRFRRAILAVLAGLATFWPASPAEASVAGRTIAPYATFDSGILRVERFGRRGARSIVFVPALFCGSWQWNAQIDALSPKYDVLVVTLPGFDGRPMIAGDDLMQRAARSLHLLIVQNALHRPILVGHSLGGTLGVYFAEHYPRDLTGLVTVEGGYPAAATQKDRDASVAKGVAPYRNLPQSQVGPVIREATLQYTITSKADVAAVERLAARSDPAAIVAWMQAALSLDLTPGLAKIVVPFTVIIPFDPTIDPYAGFATETQKRAAYDRWAEHAPNAEVIVIENSRHFVMFDRPVKFERALGTAIAR